MWGIDRLRSEQLPLLRRRLQGSKVGVLSHAPAVDASGLHLLRVLELIGVEPRVLFTPEHGFDGIQQAEERAPESVESLRWPRPAVERPIQPETELASEEARSHSGLERIVSLYGATKQSLTPADSDLDGLDVLLIDLVDIGTRVYTYAWTALLAARAAEKKGIHTLVLDRPNPISGDPERLEGTPQDEGYLSFVGLEAIPMRHSLTLGELLCHFFQRAQSALGPEGALSVVGVRGWERHKTARAWDVPFPSPSPNMPSVETALVYPGGCLLEGTNLSEGRGTTLPFQLVGAPFLDAERLANDLGDAALPGVVIHPVAFRPTFDKHAHQICRGVRLSVTDPERFRPVATYLTLITLARLQATTEFRFLNREYEFETDRPAFDLLTGSARPRLAIEGGACASELVELVTPVDSSWKDIVGEAEHLSAQARA